MTRCYQSTLSSELVQRNLLSGSTKSFVSFNAECYIFTPIISSVQAGYARDVIVDRIKLPNSEELKTDIENWLSKEPNNHDYLGCIQFQVDYIKDLLSKILKLIYFQLT